MFEVKARTGRVMASFETREEAEEYVKEYNRFVVMLLPARTDTRWFQRYVYNKAFLWFVDGRLKFGNNGNSAPFPSVVAVYVNRH